MEFMDENSGRPGIITDPKRSIRTSASISHMAVRKERKKSIILDIMFFIIYPTASILPKLITPPRPLLM